MNKKVFIQVAVITVVLLASLSCDILPKAGEIIASATTVAGMVPTTGAAPTATTADTTCAVSPPHDYTGAPPRAGAGNLYGVIRWNGEPVPDLEIQACPDANYKYECEEPIYTATSDSSGAFIIADIPPGEYEVVVHAIDQNRWLDVSAITEDYSTVEIPADQCISTGEINMVKYDLFQQSPPDEATLDEARPTLTWDEYPDAAYYLVYWGSSEGQAIFYDERANTNEITPQVDIPTCQYAWKVEAYNSAGVAIAATENFFTLYVINQPISCYIVGNLPASNSTVDGEGIVLSWDAHPLADHYQVSMVMSDPTYQRILDYIEVTEPRYALEVTLDPGEYYWNVYAIDQFGNTVAGDQGNTYLDVK